LLPAETGDALLVLAIFLLPGFITQLIKERTHEVPGRISAFERLLTSLYYSLLVYLPLAVAAAIAGLDRADIERIYGAEEGLWPLIGVAAISGLALPSVVALLSAAWTDSGPRAWVFRQLRIRPTHGTPTAWDHFFGIELPAFVRVTTRSGTIVGGYYGGLSFSTYGRDERDLYLEQQWQLNARTYAFMRPVARSMGTWIDGSDIVQLEFYAVSDEEADAFSDASPSESEG
jgi:hypothetical protein